MAANQHGLFEYSYGWVGSGDWMLDVWNSGDVSQEIKESMTV
jgi:hypothetical protein